MTSNGKALYLHLFQPHIFFGFRFSPIFFGVLSLTDNMTDLSLVCYHWTLHSLFSVPFADSAQFA